MWTIGIDEAGRGCLFGRVYAAAVILEEEHGLGVRDSKKLTEKKDETCFVIK